MSATMSPTALVPARPVMGPEVAVMRTWPVVPVSPKRSARRSWPSCESVPGMTKESS